SIEQRLQHALIEVLFGRGAGFNLDGGAVRTLSRGSRRVRPRRALASLRLLGGARLALASIARSFLGGSTIAGGRGRDQESIAVLRRSDPLRRLAAAGPRAARCGIPILRHTDGGA